MSTKGIVPRFARGAHAFAAAAAVSTGLLGALALVGWATDTSQLTRPVGSLPPMMPLTAVLFVLSAVALGSRLVQPRPGARVLCLAAVGMIVIAAGVVLAEYATGRSLGIDWLFFGDAVARIAYAVPGRPAPSTSLAFLASALAVALVDARSVRGLRVSDLLCVATALIALLAVAGYVYGAEKLYLAPGVRSDLGMAPHTALGFVLIATGILGARVERGFMRVLVSERSGGYMARRLAAAAVAIPLAALLALALARVGLFEERLGAAVLAVVGLLVGLALVMETARRLDEADGRRLEAEQILRTSEERYRALIEQASDGVFIADLEGRYIDVNPAACAMLGRARADLVGRTIVDLLPPEDVPRLQASRAALDSGLTQTGEWRLRHADGSWLPVEVSTKLLPDGRWQAFVRDISARKAAEAALERARANERSLHEQLRRVSLASQQVSESVARLPQSSLEAVLQTIALQAQLITDAGMVAVGMGSDPDLPFKPWVFAGVPEELARAMSHHPRPRGLLGAVALRGETIRVPDAGSHAAYQGLPAGHPPVGSFMGVPIRYLGQPVGNIYVANKVTGPEFTEVDQRTIELLAARAGVAIETARLYENESLQRLWLQTVLEQMPEPVILLGADGRVVTENRAAQAFSAGDRGQRDRFGNPVVYDLCRPDGSPIPADESPLSLALSSGETVTAVELAVRTADRRMVPVLVSAAPVRDESGRVTGATGVMQDISVLKEIERLREEWTSVVAHDLRQPVSAIRLGAELVLRRLDTERPEDLRPSVERIASAAKRLNRMIDDLMDASRIEAKRLTLEPIEVAGFELVRGVLDRVGHLAADHPMRLVEEGGDVTVRVDPGRLDQVLGNLISNAAKYGAPHSEVVVTARALDTSLELIVSNRGPGISPDELPTLFARFGRTSSAKASPVEGLGLGLYMCKGLIEAHGGRIWVESTPGEVTAFHVALPAQPAAARPQSEAHP